ncbi:MAG: hypothetical protein AABX89_06040 [Candidatus Thermoplasmatota archaeon]
MAHHSLAALEAARAWAKEGLLPDESLRIIEARHAEAPPAEQGIGMLALLTLGGVLLGSALIAVVRLADLTDDPAALVMAAGGAFFVAATFVLDRIRPWAPFAEVAASAACVALGAAVLAASSHRMGGTDALPIVGPLACVLLPSLYLLRRARSAASGAAVLLFALATYRTLALVSTEAGFLFDELSVGLQVAWFALLLAQAAVVAFTPTDRAWRPLALGLALIVLVAPIILLVGDGFEQESLVGELVVGALYGGLLALALARRERAATIASALVIAGDAVVFGFDQGGALLGVVVLLAVAGGLIALGFRFRSQSPA